MSKRRIGSLPRLSVVKFRSDNRGGNNGINQPWTWDDGAKILKSGWKVVGWNDRLPEHLTRDNSIAVMFHDPDGFDYWFHTYFPDWLWESEKVDAMTFIPQPAHHPAA